MPFQATPLHIAVVIAPSAGALAAMVRSAFGPFQLHPCSTPEELTTLFGSVACDAVLLAADASPALQDAATAAAGDVALIAIVGGLDPDEIGHWQGRGAQDVLLRAELESPTLGLRVRGAIQRKRAERAARTAYSTDPGTGLPHQQQFLEHVSQLLALREREPAPMAVVVLRIEGLATIEARFGRDAAHALRRKVGVRLRAGLRASDVVASLGNDNYAVLLGSILAPEDAPRVADKLAKALVKPFKVAQQTVAVSSAIGIAQYPQDGTQPAALLRRAVGLAGSAQASGRAGAVAVGEVGAAPLDAANDP